MAIESVIEIVREYISELQTKGLEFDKVYLYGSYTNNSSNDDSNIDIMLVSKQFDYDKDRFLPLVRLSEIRTNHRIEPYMMGTNHFYNEFSPLVADVKVEGIGIRLN